MPHVVTCAMILCAHCVVHACWQACCPEVLKIHYKIFICLPFAQADGLLQELTASHFNNLNIEQQKFGILHTSGCLMVDMP